MWFIANHLFANLFLFQLISHGIADQSKDNYEACHDKYSECSLWKKANLCNSEAYRDYLAFNCPVTCDICDYPTRKNIVDSNNSEANSNGALPNNNTKGTNTTATYGKHVKNKNHYHDKRSRIPFHKKFAHALSRNTPYFKSNSSEKATLNKIKNGTNQKDQEINGQSRINDNLTIQPNGEYKIDQDTELPVEGPENIDNTDDSYTNYISNYTEPKAPTENTFSTPSHQSSTTHNTSDYDNNPSIAESTTTTTNGNYNSDEQNTTEQPETTTSLLSTNIYPNSILRTCETRKFKLVLDGNYCEDLKDQTTQKFKTIRDNIVNTIRKYIAHDAILTHLEFPDDCDDSGDSQQIAIIFSVCANHWTIHRFKKLAESGRIGEFQVLKDSLIEILEK